MSCDIHLVLEKRRKDGKWVGIDTFLGHHRLYAKKGEFDWDSPVARGRNYERFAALAGVRGNGPAARGLPLDISETTQEMVAQWGGDGHSHSWLPLKEASKIFLETEYQLAEENGYREKYPESYYFGVEKYDENDDKFFDNYRIVFWFDN